MTAAADPDAFQIQIMEAAQHLADCHSLLVHCMSNHGHAAWLSLMKFTQWSNRLHAIIFDCGPSLRSRSTKEARSKAMYDTALSACMSLNIRLDASQRKVIRRVLTDHWRWQTDEMIIEQVRMEPPVPTLCIGAVSDTLMPISAVDHVANILRLHNIDRPVYTVSMRGYHAALLETSPYQYEREIAAFLVQAQLRD